MRKRKKSAFYICLSTIFAFIRQYYFPNPFDVLGAGVTITTCGIPVFLPSVALNFFVEPFMNAFTYLVVKLYYIGGSAPALGSCLYMLFYYLHTIFLSWGLLAYPSSRAISLIIGIYIAMHVLFVMLKNKISSILRVYNL